MLLIRPLLRANRLRKKKTHVIVFFIFVVSNCGGLLTPLGDPPLFLGFLRGVPFAWTLQLWKEWLLVNGGLLIVFQFLDTHFFHREEVEEKADLDVELEEARTRFGIEGGANLLLLLAVMGAVWLSHELAWPAGAQEAAMAGVAVLSLAITKRTIRDRNHFTWGPIVEVAVLFLGIFLAMIPALRILNARSAELGIDTPREFFWATGALSSFLDNAPTYLTFAAVASGLHGVAPEGRYLGQFLASGPSAGLLLAAISCGAVMMGANTYIGNGPNFMVKAIAEKAGVRMPGFFGYMGWSCAVLIPLFAIVTIVSF
jgi:Na+/H+ antiporter NhaD/arsenite permease-like protein